LIEIRSYRRVFDLERRIYRVDRLRLNPGGVPLRGLVYFLVAVSLALAAGQLPVVALATTASPWYLSDIILPACGAALLCVIRVEGRPFHLAAAAILRYRLGHRWHSGLDRGTRPGARWEPAEILLLPDGSDSRMRRLLYRGPGAVLIAREHERVDGAADAGARPWRRSRAALIVREIDCARPLNQGTVVTLAPGSRLLVRASGRVMGRSH
jgi:hypothetical protein